MWLVKRLCGSPECVSCTQFAYGCRTNSSKLTRKCHTNNSYTSSRMYQNRKQGNVAERGTVFLLRDCISIPSSVSQWFLNLFAPPELGLSAHPNCFFVTFYPDPGLNCSFPFFWRSRDIYCWPAHRLGFGEVRYNGFIDVNYDYWQPGPVNGLTVVHVTTQTYDRFVKYTSSILWTSKKKYVLHAIFVVTIILSAF